MSIYIYGALFWLMVFVGSKIIMRKPMEERGFLEPLIMMVLIGIVFAVLIYFFGVDKTGWR